MSRREETRRISIEGVSKVAVVLLLEPETKVLMFQPFLEHHRSSALPGSTPSLRSPYDPVQPILPPSSPN